jgi:hypothetical protein
MKKLILFLLFFVHGIQAHATTLIYKNFDDLVREADGIVTGTVRSIESQYDLENEISTLVTLDQLNVLHGSYDQATLSIRLKGGQIGTEILHIAGVPRFQPGDRVLLFLRTKNANAMVPVVGWTQGVFRVITDESSGQEIITDHDGNPILDIAGSTLVKEHRHSSAALIVDLVTNGASLSRP